MPSDRLLLGFPPFHEQHPQHEQGLTRSRLTWSAAISSSAASSSPSIFAFSLPTAPTRTWSHRRERSVNIPIKFYFHIKFSSTPNWLRTEFCAIKCHLGTHLINIEAWEALEGVIIPGEYFLFSPDNSSSKKAASWESKSSLLGIQHQSVKEQFITCLEHIVFHLSANINRYTET